MYLEFIFRSKCSPFAKHLQTIYSVLLCLKRLVILMESDINGLHSILKARIDWIFLNKYFDK